MEENLLNNIEYYRKKTWKIIFQQDNDSKHNCKLTQEWLQNHELIPIVWCDNSLDLNPIENPWIYLEKQLNEY